MIATSLPFPKADLSNLPAGTKCPLVNFVFSATSLFKSGCPVGATLDEYLEHQIKHYKEPMPAGPGLGFLLKLIELNRYSPDPWKYPLVHAHIVTRQSALPKVMLRMDNTLRYHGITAEADTSFVFTAYLNGFDPQLAINPLNAMMASGCNFYVGTDTEVVRGLIRMGIPAGVLTPPKEGTPLPKFDADGRLILAFDGDSTIFGRSSDDVYVKGLEPFKQHELKHAEEPIEPGPLASTINAFHRLRRLFPMNPAQSPLLLYLITMRGPTGQRRAMLTLDAMDLQMDGAMFLTHRFEKGPLLRELGVDHFFDDGLNHVASAVENDVLTSHIPFGPKNDAHVQGLLDQYGRLVGAVDG